MGGGALVDMHRFLVRALSLVAAVQVASAIGQAPVATHPTVCETLDSCVAEVLATAQSRRQVGRAVEERLATYGEDAVAELVPLLMHPNAYVRESAGLALTKFRQIDPRHLPALVRAWREGDAAINDSVTGLGNGWMPRPIAATGTDEALSLLSQDFLRDPQHASNAQVVFALADMGERIRPLLVDRISACQASMTDTECAGIYSLLSNLEPPFPPWSVEAIVDLATHARSDGVRAEAEQQLVRLAHPAGLALTQRRLASLPPEFAVTGEGGWDVRFLIRDVASYGNAASTSGAVIAGYLDPRFDQELRTDAALALGQIGDTTAVPTLLALAPELPDDWLLAYNVVESLGQLRAVGARSLVERVARDHWHRGVRHNAARALNAISGGAFTRPEIEGDGQPYSTPTDEEGNEYL